MAGRAGAVPDDRAVEPRLKRYAGRVVVTGSGLPPELGQAVLQRFADEGAAGVVSDGGTGGEGLASSDDASAVVAGVEARGAWVMFQPCDVTDAVQCEALVAATVAAFGRIINIASQAAKSGFPDMAGDTAAACAWLASADAVYVTGKPIDISGGEAMHWHPATSHRSPACRRTRYRGSPARAFRERRQHLHGHLRSCRARR